MFTALSCKLAGFNNRQLSLVWLKTNLVYYGSSHTYGGPGGRATRRCPCDDDDATDDGDRRWKMAVRRWRCDDDDATTDDGDATKDDATTDDGDATIDDHDATIDDGDASDDANSCNSVCCNTCALIGTFSSYTCTVVFIYFRGNCMIGRY